jgi:hypothetical protein
LKAAGTSLMRSPTSTVTAHHPQRRRADRVSVLRSAIVADAVVVPVAVVVEAAVVDAVDLAAVAVAGMAVEGTSHDFHGLTTRPRFIRGLFNNP